MDTIDSGSILLAGHNLAECTEKELAALRLKSTGFVFQQPSLLRNLSIIDNIMLPALHLRQNTADAIRSRAEELMELTGIQEIANRAITKVSGGQLQRAGICRALMNEPIMLFCDEPTGALNSGAAEGIMELLETVNRKGTTIMLVTHDPKNAARCNHTLFMKDGKICSELSGESYQGLAPETRRNLLTAEMEKFAI
jgi:putative ABC transport system ATP-binding protein